MTAQLSAAMQQHPAALLFVPIEGGYLAFTTWAQFEAWRDAQ